MNGSGDRRERLQASVIKGADNYLFHRDHEAVEQVSGRLPLSEADLQVWRNAVETRYAWCCQNRIAYRFLIIPEKHVVYSDKLEGLVALSENRPSRQLLRALPSTTLKAAMYPLEILASARTESPTYFITDTHWTMFGGFLTYRALVESLQKELDLPLTVKQSDLVCEEKEHTGDLGVRLDPEQTEQALFVKHAVPRSFKLVFENKVFTRGNLAVYETSRTDLPRCVMFRDSFSNYMIPHMIPSFSRLTVFGSQHMHYDLVRSERPDVVVHAIAERFLGFLNGDGTRQLPSDLDQPLFDSYAGVPLELLSQSKSG